MAGQWGQAPRSLREALGELAPGHPLVAALADGPGASAAVPYRVSHRTGAGAVAVSLTLRGPGAADARLLDIEVAASDLAVHTMRGGAFEAAYPPAAFAPQVRVIHPRLAEPYPPRLASIEFGSAHGCSSDAEVPFFLLSTLDGQCGLWFAVSWSGSWRATVTKQRRRDAHRLTITGPGCDVVLADGEELAPPTVVVGAYTGDGWASVRAHLAAVAARRATPWVVYNTWFNENADITAERLLANLAVAKQIGVEVVTLDGAWYETPTGGEATDFATAGIGTWTPDPVRFPDGLEPVAAAVNEAGLRFGLWCEFERAHRDSAVARAHPEWVRLLPDQSVGLVDLGRADARDWALDLLSGMVARWSLGWLKIDLTTHDIAAYWAGDERAELAHIRGLYAVLDELRRRHPDLVIEGCASGGNRIDREMVARCDTFWLSDQTISPDLVRATVFGARRLLPAQYCYLSVAPQLDSPVAEFPDEWFVGVMPGVFGLMDRLREWPASLRDQAAAHIAQYKEIRHLLDGAATRFGGRPDLPLHEWDALELAGDQGSVLFAHRLLSPDSTRVFVGARRWEVTIDQPGRARVEVAP